MPKNKETADEETPVNTEVPEVAEQTEPVTFKETEVWKFLNADEEKDSPAKAELRAVLKRATQENPVKSQADIEDFKRQLNDPKFNQPETK